MSTISVSKSTTSTTISSKRWLCRGWFVLLLYIIVLQVLQQIPCVISQDPFNLDGGDAFDNGNDNRQEQELGGGGGGGNEEQPNISADEYDIPGCHDCIPTNEKEEGEGEEGDPKEHKIPKPEQQQPRFPGDDSNDILNYYSDDDDPYNNNNNDGYFQYTTGQEQWAGMEVLIAIFFLVAACWLFLAIVYSIIILILLRLQARGELDYYDEDFGLLTCCNGHFHIHFGCILRRYAIQLEREQEQRRLRMYMDRNGGSNNVDVNDATAVAMSMNQQSRRIRIMTRDERRCAMERILIGNPKATNANTNLKSKDTKTTQKNKMMLSSSSTLSCCTTTTTKSNKNNSIDVISTQEELTCTRLNDDDYDDNGQKMEEVKKMIELEQQQHQMQQQQMQQQKQQERVVDCNDQISLVSEGPICTICLSEYEPNDDIFISKTCPHRFHRECIMDWLERRSNTECPCCRKPLVSDDEVWKQVKALRRERRRQLRMSNDLLHRCIQWILQRTCKRRRRRTRSDDDDDDDDDDEDDDDYIDSDDIRDATYRHDGGDHSSNYETTNYTDDDIDDDVIIIDGRINLCPEAAVNDIDVENDVNDDDDDDDSSQDDELCDVQSIMAEPPSPYDIEEQNV